MTLAFKPNRILSLIAPALVFLACTIIFFSTTYKLNTNKLSYPLLIDLLVVAPVAYFVLSRNSKNAMAGAIRIFMAGIFLASLLFSKNQLPVFIFIKKYIAPVAEAGLIGFVIYNLFVKNKSLPHSNAVADDFLVKARVLLFCVFSNEKIANIFASEISLFYYLFYRRAKSLNDPFTFTTYKENGSRLVLTTFLFLFIVETSATHFLFQLWSHTAAWVITGLGAYSCFQLWAHINALRSRPTIIAANKIYFRNGLLGGEAILELDNIETIEITKRPKPLPGAVHIAFIKGLENPNIVIHLKQPIDVIKAFGIKKTGSILFVNIDRPQAFIAACR